MLTIVVHGTIFLGRAGFQAGRRILRARRTHPSETARSHRSSGPGRTPCSPRLSADALAQVLHPPLQLRARREAEHRCSQPRGNVGIARHPTWAWEGRWTISSHSERHLERPTDSARPPDIERWINLFNPYDRCRPEAARTKLRPGDLVRRRGRIPTQRTSNGDVDFGAIESHSDAPQPGGLGLHSPTIEDFWRIAGRERTQYIWITRIEMNNRSAVQESTERPQSPALLRFCFAVWSSR